MKVQEFIIKVKETISKNFINFSIWYFLIGIVVLSSLISNAFLNQSNLINILRETVIVGVVGVGMTYIIVSGCFDLSAGAILGLSAVISLTVNPIDTKSTLLAIFLPIIIGAIFGLMNGILVGYLKMNAFITTLGMQYLILGITLLFTGGRHISVYECSDFFYKIGNGFVFGIPISVVILLILVTIAQFVLSFTNLGKYIQVVGENSKAATLSGINVSRVRCNAYIILGICASIGGIILASWIRMLDPQQGIGYEFSAITATILGGASLSGGKGNVFNTFAGATLIILIVNSMMLVNISYNYQQMIRGIIMIAGVAVGIIYGKKEK